MGVVSTTLCKAFDVELLRLIFAPVRRSLVGQDLTAKRQDPDVVRIPFHDPTHLEPTGAVVRLSNDD